MPILSDRLSTYNLSRFGSQKENIAQGERQRANFAPRDRRSIVTRLGLTELSNCLLFNSSKISLTVSSIVMLAFHRERKNCTIDLQTLIRVFHISLRMTYIYMYVCICIYLQYFV